MSLLHKPLLPALLLTVCILFTCSCGKNNPIKPGNPPGDPTPNGLTVSDFAGTGDPGFTSGASTVASFSEPRGIAVDAAGNVYVADSNNNSIRKITPAGIVSTLAGNGTEGTADGDGGNAQFNYPEALAVDAAGNVYVADTFNNLIRKVTPTGTVSTIAGGTKGLADGLGDKAKFDAPAGIAIDSFGDLIVTDFNNGRIRKVTTGGVVTTLPDVSFSGPQGIAIDATGDLFVVESGKSVVKKITPGGDVHVIAGNIVQGGFANGPGSSARFFDPEGIALDATGNLYVGDLGNNMVRKITPAGMVSTLAGSSLGHINGAALAAKFYAPSGIAIDASGAIYVADAGNYRIRKIQ